MSSVIVLRNAAMALPGIAAVGVRVMMCSFVLVVALCVGLCLVDARSCCVRAIPNVVCNDRLRDISWRVCVFRASLCNGCSRCLLRRWLRVRWLCVMSLNVSVPRSGGLESVAFCMYASCARKGVTRAYLWILE